MQAQGAQVPWEWPCLVDEVLVVVVRQRLRRAYDLVQVGVHQVIHLPQQWLDSTHAVV